MICSEYKCYTPLTFDPLILIFPIAIIIIGAAVGVLICFEKRKYCFKNIPKTFY